MTEIRELRLDTETRESEATRKFAGFVRDEGTRAALQAALGPEGVATVRQGGIDEAILGLAADAALRSLVVDVSGCADVAKSLDRLAEVCWPGTVVIAVGDVNDVALYRTLRAAGVADYLVKPVTSEGFQNALDAAFRPNPTLGHEKAAPRGDSVAVVGARGGVGSTMVATTLAWLFAEEQKRRTVLIDLDLHGGTTGLALDSEPGRGLSEALANPDRIDSLFLSSAAVRVAERLSLLASEEPFDSLVEMRPGGLELLLKEARKDFEQVVVDVPRSGPDLLRRVAGLATVVIVVTDFSLAGLRDAGRILNFAREAGPEAKLLLVGNRAGISKNGGVPRADIEKTLDISFSAIIPEDAAAVARAINVGKPLTKVAGRSKAVVAMRGLASSFGPQGRPRPSLFSRLLKNADRSKPAAAPVPDETG